MNELDNIYAVIERTQCEIDKVDALILTLKKIIDQMEAIETLIEEETNV